MAMQAPVTAETFLVTMGEMNGFPLCTAGIAL